MESLKPRGGFNQSMNDNGSIASDSPSEFSEKDAVNPNLRELMEQSFKDKYEIMKRAYQSRIEQLSQVIQETCQQLVSDEVLANMKGDPTSQDYIPAHLQELLSTHVHSERERYIHDLVSRLASLESAGRQSADKVLVQERKIRHLESDVSKGRKAEVALDALFMKFGDLERKHEELLHSSANLENQMTSRIEQLEKEKEGLLTNIENLNNAVIEKGTELEGLKLANENHIKEIDMLQEAAEQSARDLAVIEDIDREDQKIKAGLKTQCENMKAERDGSMEECKDLKQKQKYMEEDMERMESQLEQAEALNAENKTKTQALMKQVEGMLAQEAQESNAAIAIVHEKMVNLRHKLSTEIQKEKRHSAAQNEELEMLRAYKDEKAREIRILQEDEALLREKLGREQQRVLEFQMLHTESSADVASMKKSVEDAEFRSRQSLDALKIIEERLIANEKKFAEELTLAEQRVRVEKAQEMTETLDHMDVRERTYKLRYQNELGAMQNQLRHSYGGKPSVFPHAEAASSHAQAAQGVAGLITGMQQAQPQIVHVPTGAHAGAGGTEAQIGTLQAEVLVKQAKEHWLKEKSLLEGAAAEHIVKIEALESELTTLRRSNTQLRDTIEEAVANEKQSHIAKMSEVEHKSEMQLRSLKDALSEANKNIEQLKKMHGDKRRLVEDLQQQLAAAHSGVQAHASELDHHRASHESTKQTLMGELEHHKAGHEHHRAEASRVLQAHTKFVREAKLAHEAVVAELEKTRAAHADVHEDLKITQAEIKTHIEAHAALKGEHSNLLAEYRAVEQARKENAKLVESSQDETVQISEAVQHERQQNEVIAKEYSAVSARLDDLSAKHNELQVQHQDLLESHSKERISHSNNIELLSHLRGYYHDMEEYSRALEKRLEEKGVDDPASAVDKPRPHIHHHPEHEQSLHGAIADVLGEFGHQDDYLKQTRHHHISHDKSGKHSAHIAESGALHHKGGEHDRRHSHHHHHHHHRRDEAKDVQSPGAKMPVSSRRRTSSTSGKSGSHSEVVPLISAGDRSADEVATDLSHAVARCKSLEATVRSLEEELDRTKTQALADHAQDTQMLAEMKAQFDSLMISYSEQEKEEKTLENVASAETKHATEMEEENEAITGIVNEETAVLAEMEKKLEEYEDQIIDMSTKMNAQSKEIEALKKDKGGTTGASSQGMDIEEQAALQLELRQTAMELASAKKTLKTMQAQQQPPLLGGLPPRAEEGALMITDLGAQEVREQILDRNVDQTVDQPGTVTAFESLSKGILDALVDNQVLSAPAATELVAEAANTEQPSVMLSSSAQMRVSAALKPFKDGHKEWLTSVAVIESLQEELNVTKRQLSDAVEGAEHEISDHKKRHSHHSSHHHHSSSAYDESETVEASTPASKTGSTVRAGELEQSRSEAQLVLELTKLEGDARVKTLIGKIKDMKKGTAAAIERVKQEKMEALNVLQSKHEARVEVLTEEIEGLKKTVNQQADSLAEQSLARSSTLDSKLQLERAKRKDLIREFEKIDQEHRVTIEELESLNLQLEQRCERAELQVTKLRMDAIGKEAEYGSFESGPHMSTEDNIIMRMFSPPGKKTTSGGDAVDETISDSKGGQGSNKKKRAQAQAEEAFEAEFAESLSLASRDAKGGRR